MLIEICRKPIYISKHEETSLSWNNNVLILHVNKQLTFFDFKYDLSSLEKKVDFIETAVKCPTNSPLPPDYLEDFVRKGIRNVELVEMVTNPVMSSYNKFLEKEMANIKSYKCSPDNLIYNYQNIVAVVNTFGNVDFLASNNYSHKNLMNFSSVISKQLGWPDAKSEIPKTLEDLKEKIYKVVTSAVCWSSEKYNENSCYFVTAQKSGHLLFWSIRSDGRDVKVKFCSNFKTNSSVEIDVMLWIPLYDNKILLICSNISGEIIGYEFDLNKFELIKEHCLWGYKDRMISNYLHFYKCNDNIIFICNKNRHILIQLYDRDLRKLCEKTQIVNDERITSIISAQDCYYIGTKNTKIYKLNIIVDNNNLNVSLNLVAIKENYAMYELDDIGVSKNSAIFALVLKYRKLLHRKEMLKIEIAFLSFDNTFDKYMCTIINNPSQNLSDIWDYIDLLRCKIMKTKTVYEYDYNMLLESDVYTLKVYYVMLIFYTALKSSKALAITALPNTSIEEIKDKLMMHQAVALLSQIYDEYKSNKKVDKFTKECLVGAKRYLLYYSDKYKKSVHELVDKAILDNDATISYTCQGCDGYLEGFTCKDGHLNMFCSLTFSPIEGSEYLVCKGCGVTARVEMYNTKPTCLFCDIHFDHIDDI